MYTLEKLIAEEKHNSFKHTVQAMVAVAVAVAVAVEASG